MKPESRNDAADAMYDAICDAALARCKSEAATRKILAGFEFEHRFAKDKHRAGLEYVISRLKEKMEKSWPGLLPPDPTQGRYP